MRPLLAVLLTVALPGVVGARAFATTHPVRWLLGLPLGVVFLGAGAAVGAAVASLAGVPPTGTGATLLLGGAIGLTGLWFLGGARPLRVEVSPAPRVVRAVWVGVAVLGCVVLLLALARPLVSWDSWVMWSLKAKALAATGNFDHPVFTAVEYRHTHPYYPPLLPAWQAVAYSISGTLQVAWPLQVQVGSLWLASGAALLLLVNRWGVVAVVLVFGWLTAPSMLGYVLSGYGDLPMAGFLLLAAVLWLHGREADTGPVLPWRNSWVPGALLAGAALTKQEGLLVGAVVVTALLITPRLALLRNGFRCVSAWIFLAAGLWWTVTARLLHLENPYLTGNTAAPDPPALSLAERVQMIIVSFVGESFAFEKWFLLVPVILAVLIARGPHQRLLAASLGALAAIAAVYLFTPYDLAWQLNTSAYRVIIVPVGLLALAAAARPVPDEVTPAWASDDPAYPWNKVPGGSRFQLRSKRGGP